MSDSDRRRHRRPPAPVTLSELAEITACMHEMHLRELRRLREARDRLDYPRAHRQALVASAPAQSRQPSRIGNAVVFPQQGPSTWRSSPLRAPRHLPNNRRQPSSHTSTPQRSWDAETLLVATLLTRDQARSPRRRSEGRLTRDALPTSQYLPSHEYMPTPTAPEEPLLGSVSSNLVLDADLPPPYSECEDKHEEPPPPYSDIT